MRKREVEEITNIIGVIFLLFGMGAILNAIFIIKNPSILVWFCHPALIILGIGFLIKNKNLVQSQINILAIPLIFWTLDFLQSLFTKYSVLGISQYFFNQYPITSKIITSQHLFTIPLSIWGLKYLKGKSKKAVPISIITVLILFILSKVFDPKKNINIVFKFLELTMNFYPILWWIVILVIILLTNFLINKLYESH